jgi:hypothetical protein
MIISIILGICLSATCGFRIFVPPLVLSIAYKIGFISLPVKYGWAKSNLALTILAIATIIEILAYYIPVVDNLLDTISVPTSIVAGTLMTVTFVNFDNEVLNWAMSVIFGGGAAVGISTLTSSIRVVTTTTTFGFGNGILATIEWISATTLSIITILLPILSLVFLIILITLLNYIRIKRKKKLLKV